MLHCFSFFYLSSSSSSFVFFDHQTQLYLLFPHVGSIFADLHIQRKIPGSYPKTSRKKKGKVKHVEVEGHMHMESNFYFLKEKKKCLNPILTWKLGQKFIFYNLSINFLWPINFYKFPHKVFLLYFIIKPTFDFFTGKYLHLRKPTDAQENTWTCPK